MSPLLQERLLVSKITQMKREEVRFIQDIINFVAIEFWWQKCIDVAGHK